MGQVTRYDLRPDLPARAGPPKSRSRVPHRKHQGPVAVAAGGLKTISIHHEGDAYLSAELFT